ncbi:hypothetical protein EJ06DRAFT_530958 [Trichodelitschia bisporula]|uniref:Uncharacterized protein n=1 Tax=Trichodelitschia bisporula TaxID=703511 RepID=A0A6G1HU98_9PEZI|nr:hypothetical protein EJ06DRAFT_530958 [Trichodelitschia bisporula]
MGALGYSHDTHFFFSLYPLPRLPFRLISPDLALAATLPEHRLPTWLAWGIEAGVSGALADEDGGVRGLVGGR